MNIMSAMLQVIFIVIISVSILLALYFPRTHQSHVTPKAYVVSLVIISLYILVTRLFGLDLIPGGLNQDEAAIGYDAWALANYGIDRNGFTFPILPMSWGSGAGGFIIYLGSFVFKVLPLTVMNLRLINGVIQVFTLLTFFLLLKKLFNKETALIGVTFLAISPWHILLSRWSLDANQVFSLILFGIYFYVLAIDANKKRYHLLGLCFFAMAMYSYGSGVIVTPLVLIGLYGLAWMKKQIHTKALFGYTAYLMLLTLPLMMFYFVNIFQWDSLVTPLFSIPRFNVLRSSSVIIPFDEFFFVKVLDNAVDYGRFLTLGRDDYLWNQLPGFGVVYLFTFPLFLVGLWHVRYDSKSLVFFIWFIVSSLFSLVLYQNINRMGVLFIPMMYFHIQGLVWLFHRRRVFFASTLAVMFTGAVLFHGSYLTVYQPSIETMFSKGYGEAIQFSLNLNKDKYYLPSQSQVNGSHVLALFYIQPDPHELVETGIYINPGAEFQYLSSFEQEGNQFIFTNPNMNQTVASDEVFMVQSSWSNYFTDVSLRQEVFGQFTVYYR
jgi:hypothetical protein